MNNEQLVKYRTLAVIGFGLICYPTVIVLAIISRFYQLVLSKYYRKSIAGEIALVTGAGHGLGRCMAIELAKEGCHVAVVDINIDGAEEVAQQLNENFNIKSKAYQVDVSDLEQVKQLRINIEKDLGNVTVLVNNAAILLPQKILQPSTDETKRMIDVNFKSHFWMNRTFLPKMKELKRGHIVAIGSSAAFFPVPYAAIYNSTKSAVRSLMRTLRTELMFEKFSNIKCSTVYPIFITTNERVHDLLQKTGFFLRLLSGEETARAVIDGVLRNEEDIAVPWIIGLLYRCLELLPAAWQNFFILFCSKPNLKKIVELNKADLID